MVELNVAVANKFNELSSNLFITNLMGLNKIKKKSWVINIATYPLIEA